MMLIMTMRGLKSKLTCKIYGLNVQKSTLSNKSSSGVWLQTLNWKIKSEVKMEIKICVDKCRSLIVS